METKSAEGDNVATYEETGHRWLIVITQGKGMMSGSSHTTLMHCPDGRMGGRGGVGGDESRGKTKLATYCKSMKGMSVV